LQKGWFLYTLFASIAAISLFSQEISSKTYKKLASDPYWKILLHLKNGKSEIDDPAFFLTKEKPFSPYAELNATIAALDDANESFYCRYPARIAWLKSKAPELFRDKNDTLCHKLEETLQKEDIHYVTLVFPTAYVNSPASMFGHTFLRLDKTDKTPLIGEAVNYAAQTDETNGLIYTYRGLTGGYRGFYSVLPYYKKIKEYSAMEQRDMWEYRLDLDDEEIRRMLYHLYELQGVYGDYYFFTKNCSYNLLWLLQSSDAAPMMTDAFSYKAIPIDTIRALKDAGLIRSVYFRPSQRREMQALVAKIDDKSLARAFTKSYDIALIKEQNQTQQAYMCDLALMQLKHDRTRKKFTKQNYIKKLMQLSRYRSKLPKGEKVKVSRPIDPLAAHKSAKVTIGLGTHANYSFGFKPAMHDIYDLDRGFTQGAYIDFFALSVEKGKLQRFDFVSVTSLSVVDRFFKPWSWSVRIGLQRYKDERSKFTLAGGAGKSAHLLNGIAYLLLTPQIFFGKSMHASLGAQSGLLWNRGDFKTGLRYSYDTFDEGWQQKHAEGFITWQWSKERALNLKLYEDKIADKKEQNVMLSLFVYF
jgi:hypothetical protein